MWTQKRLSRWLFGVLFSKVFTPHEGLESTGKMDWKRTEWSPECPCWSLVNNTTQRDKYYLIPLILGI